MNLWGPVLAALLGGGLVQAIVSYAGRKKTDAEATDLISQAAERIVGRLEVEITGLRSQIAELQALIKLQAEQLKLQAEQIANQSLQINSQNDEIKKLGHEINILRDEIRRLGGDPDQLVRRGKNE